MRLLHAADLHLGYREFNRVMSGDVAGKVMAIEGRNVREMDVMRTFTTLVDRAIALDPEVIVIAGDVFHSARPSNGTIVGAYKEFSRLMARLPRTTVIVIAGNHDMPRSRESANILELLRPLGIHVIDWEAQRLTFSDLDLSVLGVPEAPAMAKPALEPDPSTRYSILLLHGEVQGMMKRHGVGERASTFFTAEDMRSSEWSYTALGHYHVNRQVGPNAWYAGSTDYTSSNPWGEQIEQRDAGIPGKGFIVHDLATAEHQFHPLPESRRYIELPSFSAHELSAVDVDEALAREIAACPGGIDDQVVRVVITDCPKEVARELDAKALGSYKRRALNFNLTIRRPEMIQARSARSGGRRKPLEEIVADFFIERFTGNAEFPPERMLALSDKYMGDGDALNRDLQASVAKHDKAQESAA